MVGFIDLLQRGGSAADELNRVLRQDQALSEFMLLAQASSCNDAGRGCYSFRVNIGDNLQSSLLVEA